MNVCVCVHGRASASVFIAVFVDYSCSTIHFFSRGSKKIQRCRQSVSTLAIVFACAVVSAYKCVHACVCDE